jgi:endonuclease YncB( thermonuclease family)
MVAKIAIMKKLLIVFIAGLAFGKAFAVPVEVTKIVDGDTFMANILLKDDNKIMSVGVRIRNVDTPELHGMCEQEIKRAESAKQRLAELIPVGSVIEINNVKNDKYAGRIDANVFDASNRDVGKILIKEKLGRPYSGGKRESWCE